MSARKPTKERIREKMRSVKAKVKWKAKAVAAVALVAAISGCASSEPASRVTRAEYGDIVVKISDSSNTTVRLTLGDGALSSSDSAGSTETNSANPTNTPDVKPDVDVNVGGASGSGLGSAITSGIKAICGSDSTTTASGSCSGGNCSE